MTYTDGMDEDAMLMRAQEDYAGTQTGYVRCPVCDGVGEVDGRDCRTCQMTGWLQQRYGTESDLMAVRKAAQQAIMDAAPTVAEVIATLGTFPPDAKVVVQGDAGCLDLYVPARFGHPDTSHVNSRYPAIDEEKVVEVVSWQGSDELEAVLEPYGGQWGNTGIWGWALDLHQSVYGQNQEKP